MCIRDLISNNRKIKIVNKTHNLRLYQKWLKINGFLMNFSFLIVMIIIIRKLLWNNYFNKHLNILKTNKLKSNLNFSNTYSELCQNQNYLIHISLKMKEKIFTIIELLKEAKFKIWKKMNLINWQNLNSHTL